MRHKLLFTLAAAAMLSPGASFAQTAAPSVRVAYTDLNLSTAAGREMLDRRLDAAVKRVCPPSDARELATQRLARLCAAETGASLNQTVASLMTKHSVALASVTPSNAPAVQ